MGRPAIILTSKFSVPSSRKAFGRYVGYIARKEALEEKEFLTAEEKDEQRRQNQRERNHRHQEKTKMYAQLGALPNNKAKLIGLLKALNPGIANVNPFELEQRANTFLISMGIDPNYS